MSWVPCLRLRLEERPRTPEIDEEVSGGSRKAGETVVGFPGRLTHGGGLGEFLERTAGKKLPREYRQEMVRTGPVRLFGLQVPRRYVCMRCSLFVLSTGPQGGLRQENGGDRKGYDSATRACRG